MYINPETFDQKFTSGKLMYHLPTMDIISATGIMCHINKLKGILCIATIILLQEKRDQNLTHFLVG